LEGEEWHHYGGRCILGSNAGLWKVFQHVGLALVMLDVVIASRAGDKCSLLFGGVSSG
jgi:hypothetical protein